MSNTDLISYLEALLSREDLREDRDIIFLYNIALNGFDVVQILEYCKSSLANNDYMFDSSYYIKNFMHLILSNTDNMYYRSDNIYYRSNNMYYRSNNPSSNINFVKERNKFIKDTEFPPETPFSQLNYLDTTNILKCIADLKTDVSTFVVFYTKNGKQYAYKNRPVEYTMFDSKLPFDPVYKLANLLDMKLNIKRNTEIMMFREEDIMDYENSEHLSFQQKRSIEAMEKLEKYPIFKYDPIYPNSDEYIPMHSSKIDVFIKNKLAVKTNFGILSNLPGTGKTRIALMLAIRNKYHANFSKIKENKSRRSDISVKQEIIRIENEMVKRFKKYLKECVDRNELYEHPRPGRTREYSVSVYGPSSIIPDPTLYRDTYDINFSEKIVHDVLQVLKRFPYDAQDTKDKIDDYKKSLLETWYQPDLLFFIEDGKSYTRYEYTTSSHEANRMKYFNSIQDKLILLVCTLIVVTISTYSQWKEELENIVPEDVSYLCINRLSKGILDKIHSNEYDIILVTGSFYDKYIKDVMVNRIIFDEPDTVQYNNNVFYRFKWLVSATVGKLSFKMQDASTSAHTPGYVTRSNIDLFTNSSYYVYKGACKVPRVGTIEFDSLPYTNNGLFINNADCVEDIYARLNIFIANNVLDNRSRIKFFKYTRLDDSSLVEAFSSTITLQGSTAMEEITSGAGPAYDWFVNNNQICAIDIVYEGPYNAYIKYKLEVASLIHQVNNDKTLSKNVRRDLEEKIESIKNNNLLPTERELSSIDNKTKQILDHKNTCIICTCEVELDNAVLLNCCPWLVCKDTCFVPMAQGYRGCPVCKRNTSYFDVSTTLFYKRFMELKENSETLKALKTLDTSEAFKVSEDSETSNSPEDISETSETSNSSTNSPRVRFTEIKRITSTGKVILYATIGADFIDALREENINFRVLKGTSSKRQEIIREWKESTDPITLVLLTHKNIAGLNLTQATDIIVYNHVGTSVLLQIIGRVDRYGFPTNRNVNIHLLCPKDITIPYKYSVCTTTTISE